MIRLLHLFPNLMNLYGDWGNIAVLDRALRSMGAETEVVSGDCADGVDLMGFDFVFIGAGTEKRVRQAAERLSGMRDEFHAAAREGKVMLFTGTASELVCREIAAENESFKALGLFDAVVRRTADRQTGDVLYRSGLSDRLAAGFVNKSGFVMTEEPPLFTPCFGPGSFESAGGTEVPGEGLHRGNVFATYLTGPVLVRNPWLKKIVAEELFRRAYPGAEPKAYSDEYAEKGWSVTVSELEKRMNAARNS
ncbi:MAG: hypothetical protein PUA83_05835 [Clostridiales bacterium]|nr:hypothetical protein [Clostridiales bacterium]